VTVPRFVGRTVVGSPDHVANVLRSTMDSGRLVAATAPVPVPNAPDVVAVRMRLRAPTPSGATRSGQLKPTPARLVTAYTLTSTTPRRWRRRAAVIAALTALAAGLLAGVAYLVWLAMQALIAALPVLVAAALVLAVLWSVLGRAGVCCPGLHCPGCRHG